MESLRETAAGVGVSIPGMALVAGPDGDVAFASDSALTALGMPADGKPPAGLQVSTVIPGISWPDFQGEDRIDRLDVNRADGTVFPARVTSRRIAVDGTQLTVVLIEDRIAETMAIHEAEAMRWRLDASERLTGLGTWSWDVELDRVVWSDQLFRVFGMEPGEIEPSVEQYLAFIHPGDRDEVAALIRKAAKTGLPLNHTKRAIKADGTEFTVAVEGTLVADHDGRPRQLHGVCSDATARHEAELDRARFHALLESSLDGIVAMDLDGRIRAWSRGIERIYGYAAEEVLGKTADEFLTEEEHRESRVLLERMISGESSGLTFETTRTRRDGVTVDVSITVSPVHDARMELVGAVAVVRDISQARRFEGRMLTATSRDPLTGALNRNHFQAIVERAIEDGSAGAVFHFDLDNFKYVNDAYGYAFGDRLLRGVTRTIERECDAGCPPARLGGDEFAVLLPGVDKASALEWADRMLRQIRGYVEPVDGRPLTTTASIGICIFSSDHRMTVTEIMSRADRALYEAKDRGRDSWILASADRARSGLATRMNWEERIRNALVEDLFELYLQPIISVSTREVVMHEVLLRLIEGGEAIAPGAFLGEAERLGLIHEIDRNVIGKSLTLLERHPGLKLSVNVSGKSFGDGQLLAAMRDRIGQHGFDPSCLVIEVTETSAVIDTERAEAFARSLKELGCGFALDDFGTGFGSYAYLKKLPAEYLKIDGEFVSGEWSRVDELVIESMVGLAGGLGKQTIAEYVEAEETLDRLAAIGVDFAQGYHIGRPAPAVEVLGR